MDVNSLSHTKWNCKYHIVFAPKNRRKIVYGQLKQDIANILSSLCKRKGVSMQDIATQADYFEKETWINRCLHGKSNSKRQFKQFVVSME